MKIPTSLPKNDLFSTDGLRSLIRFDALLLEFTLDEVVDNHALGELGHAERIETPINWVPSLESVISWHEDSVFIFCKQK